MTVELEPPGARTSWTTRRLPAPALVPVAALVWWVVGFLPWIAQGLGTRSDLPVAALPLFVSNLGPLVLDAGVGGVAAGLVALVGTGGRVARAAACAGGLAIALLVTVVASRIAIGDRGGSAFGGDGRLTAAVILAVIVTAVVALGIGLLSLTGRALAGIALGTLAGAATMWVGDVIFAAHSAATGGYFRAVSEITRWSAAALLVVALVVVSVRSIGLVLAWVPVVLVAWCTAPTITAIGSLQPALRPGSGLPGHIGTYLDDAMAVWRAAASPSHRSLTPWIVAVVVAAVVSLLLAQRSSADDDDTSKGSQATMAP